MKKKLVLAVALGSSIFVMADDEHRQHGAHEHGAAKLMVAQDGTDFLLSLDTPAFNIYGFEHSPEDDQQQQIVSNAQALLKQGKQLFLFPQDAQCSLKDTAIETETGDHDGDEASQGGHSDLNVEWHFSCKQPLQATSLTLTLFDAFNNLKDLDVTYLTDSGQGAAELSASKHSFTF